ncbi:hypothetical protein KS4_12500 [Poriferisphaera corsica]|uniref:Uncharacterized protein n=1 Tax=Poriferisphaera corsica TaxID=2528020 RepID=A0A517YSJ3_9BACT|nr:hypothetical protein [Poriferisphaera corsica]QDU33205.1 hypothetical protein KS4_12500 [Poriferisphaera corsica]
MGLPRVWKTGKIVSAMIVGLLVRVVSAYVMGGIVMLATWSPYSNGSEFWVGVVILPTMMTVAWSVERGVLDELWGDAGVVVFAGNVDCDGWWGEQVVCAAAAVV